MNYSTYAYDTTGFDGEGQLTSAISYVTSDNLPILYTLEGHSEVELSTAMISSIEKENIEIKSLNLVTEESVPEDTDILMINGPQKDLSEEESQKIITYLENGGKAFIISNYTTEDIPNFNSILEDYGVQTEDGVIIEGLGVALSEIGNKVDYIFNNTFYYPDNHKKAFVDMLKGRVKNVYVNVEIMEKTPGLGNYLEDKQYKHEFTMYVRELWDKKINF